ncbi:MAG TPA: transcriptional regulator, partial [Eubacteriaceae bacterium]|nr:transcriptional regulator [Eubacteriaceae bacterium]
KVGKSIVEVVNKLLNTDHAKGIEMGLDENPKEALERTIDLIQKTDMKKGTVLMVDMGSLTTFGEVITKRTGIEVRVLDRVDTLLALDVTRRALVPEATLDDVVSRVEENGRKVKRAKGKINEYNYDQNLPKAIVTICITGDGSAEKLKEYVSKVIDKTHSSLTVISIGVISPVDIDLRIRRIMDNYNVVAFVGTIDPEIVDVPFISIQNLLDYKGIEQIQKIVMEAETKRESIDDLLDEDLVFFDKSFKGKDEAIDFLVEKMQAKGYVDKNFLLSVYKREMMVPTYLKGGIAIPHGFPQYVTKPVISILKLPQKMTWMGDEGEVDLIFLIAYKNNSKKYFQNVYKILLNQEIIQKMKAIEKERDMIDFMKMHASE